MIVPTNELHLLCEVKLFYTYFTECNTKGRENFKPYSTAAVVSVTGFLLDKMGIVVSKKRKFPFWQPHFFHHEQ